MQAMGVANGKSYLFHRASQDGAIHAAIREHDELEAMSQSKFTHLVWPRWIRGMVAMSRCQRNEIAMALEF